MNISLTDKEQSSITCPSNHTVYNDIGRLFATLELRNAHSYCDDSESATLSIAVADSLYDVHDVIVLAIAGSPHLLRYTATYASTRSVSCDTYITVQGNTFSHVITNTRGVMFP